MAETPQIDEPETPSEDELGPDDGAIDDEVEFDQLHHKCCLTNNILRYLNLIDFFRWESLALAVRDHPVNWSRWYSSRGQ